MKPPVRLNSSPIVRHPRTHARTHTNAHTPTRTHTCTPTHPTHTHTYTQRQHTRARKLAPSLPPKGKHARGSSPESIRAFQCWVSEFSQSEASRDWITLLISWSGCNQTLGGSPRVARRARRAGESVLKGPVGFTSVASSDPKWESHSSQPVPPAATSV